LKITEEVLKNGEWISDELFRYPLVRTDKKRITNYRKVKCLNCGEECFIRYNRDKGYCDKRCMLILAIKNRVIRNESKYDKTGMKFNRLLVLEKVIKIERNRNTTYWKCQCDCGNETEVENSNLTSSGTQSCGCLGREIYLEILEKGRNHKKSLEERKKISLGNIGKGIINLVGKRFGRLLVIGRGEDRFNKKGHRILYWFCQCDCGNKKEIRTGHLNDKENSIKSCGCLTKENFVERTRKVNIKKANQLGFADYDTFAERLKAGGEEVSRHPDEPEVLQVKCKYCGKKFSPKPNQAMERCRFIEGTSARENSLYCSTGCQKSCPLFYKTEKSYLNYMNGTISLNREVQPELRQMRFKLDDYTCQRCETRGGELHCHHYEGIEQNPIESADLDNCVTLCVDCHKFVHQQDGCTYYDLRKCEEYKYNSTPEGEAIYV